MAIFQIWDFEVSISGISLRHSNRALLQSEIGHLPTLNSNVDLSPRASLLPPISRADPDRSSSLALRHRSQSAQALAVQDHRRRYSTAKSARSFWELARSDPAALPRASGPSASLGSDQSRQQLHFRPGRVASAAEITHRSLRLPP